MKNRLRIVLLMSFFFLMIIPSHVYGFAFGLEETIYQIKETEIRGPDNQELCLSYKVTQKYFFLPLWITEGDYVLSNKDYCNCDREQSCTSDSYFPLEDAEIKKYQASNLLDTPLPVFEMTIFERFAIWFFLGGFLVLYLIFCAIKERFSGRSDEDSSPEQEAEIEVLEAELEALKAKAELEALEAELEALKAENASKEAELEALEEKEKAEAEAEAEKK